MKYNILKLKNGKKLPTETKFKSDIDSNIEKIITMYLDSRKAGLNDNQTFGLLGNIAVETGGSFSPVQKQYKNGPGIGYIQTEKNTERYKRMLNEVSELSDGKQQFNYILSNFFENGRDNSTIVWGKYNNQDKWWKGDHSSPEHSSKLTSELFLRPGKPNLHERKLASKYISNKVDPYKKAASVVVSPWTSFTIPPKYLVAKPKNWINPKEYLSNNLEMKRLGGKFDVSIISNILTTWKK